MHAAKLARSPRLQSVRDALADGKWHSTRDIIRETGVCAVNSCVAELRANGVRIDCIQQPGQKGGRVFLYRMLPPDRLF